MRVMRPRIVYFAVGVVLAGVSGASLIWANTTAPTAQASVQVSEKVSEPVGAAGAVDEATPPTGLPVDAVISGAATAIAVQQNFPDPSSAAGSQLHLCESTIDGWLRADSTRATTPGGGATIFVGAWRAGSATAAFAALRDAASRCYTVSASEGTDRLLATSTTVDGRRSVSAIRTGDLVTVAVVSSMQADPTPTAQSIADATPTVLGSRLRGVCVNPGSQTTPKDAGRDPYSKDYVGLTVESEIPVPDNPVLDAQQVDGILATKPTATWSAPKPQPFPQLAPLLRPVLAGAVGTDPATPTSTTPTPGPPPKLIDPASIVAPPVSRPAFDVVEEPARPESGPELATANIPKADVVGPGCGWSFTGTVPPIPTPEQIASQTRDVTVKALIEATAQQGKAMAAALQWPEDYFAWVPVRRAQLDWAQYDATVDLAKKEMLDAKRSYQASVDRWEAGTAPSTVPDPSIPSDPNIPSEPAAPSDPSASPDPGVTSGTRGP